MSLPEPNSNLELLQLELDQQRRMGLSTFQIEQSNEPPTLSGVHQSHGSNGEERVPGELVVAFDQDANKSEFVMFEFPLELFVPERICGDRLFAFVDNAKLVLFVGFCFFFRRF